VARSNVAIIIPAFNEESSIVTVINEVQQYGDVIIVDDGSSDSTVELVAKTSAIVLCHKSNLGYERALSTGFTHAIQESYLYIITTDADGELRSYGINEILGLLKKNFLLVVGRRTSKNRFIENIFGSLSFGAFGIHDPLCGMKGYSAKLYRKYGFFDTQNMIGTELLALAIRDNITIKEIPIDVQKRHGESRFGGSLSSLLKITRVIYLFFKLCIQKKV
jgi:glycosyltransferase involved in cell wall biosynthesis